MRITIHWTPHRAGEVDDQEVELHDAATATVGDLLEAIDEPHEGILAVRDGTPIPLDSSLVDGEKIRLVRTVSGG